MTVARFRFYEELNDFLAPEHHKREFDARCARAATVKNAIEALGVPPASAIPAEPGTPHRVPAQLIAAF